MELPDDLVVDMRQQRIVLSSASLDVHVVIENSSRFGPFSRGPISWKSLQNAYLAPALDQFRVAAEAKASRC